MKENPTITMDTPADFVRFLRAFGLKSPMEDGMVVLRVTTNGDNDFDYDEAKPTFLRYQAPVIVFDRIGELRYNATPPIPFGWKHAPDQKITIKASTKRDAIDTLQIMGVTKDRLKMLSQIKVAQLHELVDSSPVEDDNVEEILQRTTRTAPNEMVFPIQDGPVKEILVKLTKERHSTALAFELAADFKQHWVARETAIHQAVEQAGFRVYEGSLS